ncbi:MAG: hypothetical protein K6T59_14235, partial [Bryobacteraceae bacterium]|nr:hypothetical protein [Bryobacteraceae bacterium]
MRVGWLIAWLAIAMMVGCQRPPETAAQAPVARVANASPAAEPAAPFTYVALGASDTVGVGTNDPTREGWVYVLSQHLPPATRVVNLGISGALLQTILQRQLPRA